MTLYELFSLLGGVGLFLYGMTSMSTGLKNACGEKLRTILEYATKNKLISVLVGVAVTMLIQSSSATDVMIRQLWADEPEPGHRRHHGRQYRHHHHGPDHRV